MTTTDFMGCQRYDVSNYGGADTKQKVVLDGHSLADGGVIAEADIER